MNKFLEAISKEEGLMSATVVAQLINILLLLVMVMIPILILKKLTVLSKHLEKVTLDLNEIKEILLKNQTK